MCLHVLFFLERKYLVWVMARNALNRFLQSKSLAFSTELHSTCLSTRPVNVHSLLITDKADETYFVMYSSPR